MITKEEAKEKIKELVREFSECSREQLDSRSENQIQSEFIDPLFEALGWDMRKEARREERIQKGRADYILRIGNQDRLIIEAKKTNVILSDDGGRQAVSYAHSNHIKFAVVTNFKEIKIYHALSRIKNIDNNLLKDERGPLRINYEDFEKQFDRLWLLSKESFEKEEINKLLQNVKKKLIKPIDDSILSDLLEYRRLLSTDLKSKRTLLEDSQIDEIVQILIDRLIFMRSVEDRGLEGRDFLLTIIRNFQGAVGDRTLWALLKDQFERFDTTYNSKLFSEGLLEKGGAFGHDVLIKVIKGLYFGIQGDQIRYEFNEIPVDLLGTIYEQYLGTILRGTDKRVKLDSESGKRKKMGIYYTPSYIVDYIVKNTVVEYIKDKSIDEILEVRILDPACGSGSFLIRAFGEVCDKVEGLMKNHSETDNSTFKRYDGRLNLAQKITILTRCIYGVDLDEKAVELAQLNLLLRLLEGETRDTKKKLLPNINSNIKCGNSLIDDIMIDKNKAFKWEAQFQDVFRKGGFDIIIGNPPYFNLQTIKEEKQIQYFKEKYASYRGKADILYLFIEKYKSILNKDGLLGIITANYFLRSHYADKLRKMILDNYNLIKIIDFGSIKVFGDANVDTCIIIVDKIKLEDNEYVYGLLHNENRINEFLDNSLKERVRMDRNYEIKVYSQNKLNEKPWKFQDNELKETIHLSEICYIGKGVATGNDKIFVIDNSLAKKLKIEKELIEVLVEDSSIDRYHFNLSNKILIKSKEETNISKFENTKKYLESQKKSLQERYAVKREGLRWYEIVRYNKDLFSPEVKEQIYVYYRSKYNKFAYSDKRFVTLTTTFVLTPKPNSKINQKYLLGILNSKFMQNYSINNAKKMGSCFEYSSNFIGSIPIKIPDEKQEQRLTELVNQMLGLQRRFHNKEISGGEKERLEQQIKSVDYEIDQEVYDLYGITDKEKEVIEESLN